MLVPVILFAINLLAQMMQESKRQAKVIKNTFKEDIAIKCKGRYCLHKQSPSMEPTLTQ